MEWAVTRCEAEVRIRGKVHRVRDGDRWGPVGGATRTKDAFFKPYRDPITSLAN